MRWKDWPAWMKGGVIAIIIYFLGFVFLLLLGSLRISSLLPQSVLVIFNPVWIITIFNLWNYDWLIQYSFIIDPLIFLLIGMLVGWIVGKIRNK